MSVSQENYDELEGGILEFNSPREAEKVYRLSSEAYDEEQGGVLRISYLTNLMEQTYHRVGARICVNGDNEDVENLKKAADALNRTGSVEDALGLLEE